MCFAGTPVAIAITVRLRLCPPKPSASLHSGASRHPFTWPWAAMGSGGHSLQPSSFRFDCIDSPECALSSLRPSLAEATAVALSLSSTPSPRCHPHHLVFGTLSITASLPSPPPRRHRHSRRLCRLCRLCHRHSRNRHFRQ